MTPPDRETLARIVQNAMSAVGLGKWHEAVSIAVDELVVLFPADAERVKELESERGLAYVAGLETGRMESLFPTADLMLSEEWAIVPRIPTPKMVKAGRNVGHNENARLKWSAMLSATPTPQTRTPSQ